VVKESHQLPKEIKEASGFSASEYSKFLKIGAA